MSGAMRGSIERSAGPSSHLTGAPCSRSQSWRCCRLLRSASFSATDTASVNRYPVSMPVDAFNAGCSSSCNSRQRRPKSNSGPGMPRPHQGSSSPKANPDAWLPMESRSIMTGRRPRLSSSYAVAQPTIPPPMITTSAGAIAMKGCRRRPSVRLPYNWYAANSSRAASLSSSEPNAIV